ncbi:MAG: sigma-70 family RNA polymerase sigma factor [Clostridia bacterium]|nr:sigma-70 family RNA polymerase sigma factor [Clostridia bacterium]
MRAALARIFSRGEVYYISGTDTLPRPLSPEEEADAILRLPHDEDARDLLVEHNLRLVAYIAKRFENTGASVDELISIGTLGLMKAIATFHPDRGIKLATYASRCIENEILMFLRKASARRAEISIDEPLRSDENGGELLLSDVLGGDADEISRELEEEEERRLVRELVAALGERERRIIELRFGLSGGRELTQKEVADRLHISQSYISRLEKRIMAQLKEKLEACL